MIVEIVFSELLELFGGDGNLKNQDNKYAHSFFLFCMILGSIHSKEVRVILQKRKPKKTFAAAAANLVNYDSRVVPDCKILHIIP